MLTSDDCLLLPHVPVAKKSRGLREDVVLVTSKLVSTDKIYGRTVLPVAPEGDVTGVVGP